MDEDKASRFISSLVKSIQALCNGFVDFSTSIEVIGHIHLNIDRSVKLDYVLTEEVSKSVSEGSTVFSSHSYHSQAPPSITSKSASDTSNHGQKSRKDNEADPLGLSALPREVPNTSKSDSHSLSSNRVGDSSNSSHTFSGSVGFSRNSDSESVKLENNRSSCQVEDSSNKRRKMGPLSQTTPPPAAKRGRSNDFGSGSKTVVQESGFEVIEIKEEPDDDVPAVFFGSSGSGQDIQTPDFSNVVMESLDRVNQLEQSTDLVDDGGDGMGTPQQPVFPVMFHQSDGMPSSSAGPVPGPLSDPQSIASTSGDAPKVSGTAAADDDQHVTSPSSTSDLTPTTTTTTATTTPATTTSTTPTPSDPISTTPTSTTITATTTTPTTDTPTADTPTTDTPTADTPTTDTPTADTPTTDTPTTITSTTPTPTTLTDITPTTTINPPTSSPTTINPPTSTPLTTISPPTPTPINPLTSTPTTIDPPTSTPLTTMIPTTPTNPSPTPTSSSATPVGPASSQGLSPYTLPPRPHVSIPPISPRFKPEDLPPDTKREDVARLTERHVLERVPPTERKKYPSKRCKVCLRRSGYGPGPARKHPKESVYYCPQCPSKPGLCCYPCYYVYHSKLNFWEPDEGEGEEEQGGGGSSSMGGTGGGLAGGRYPDSGGSRGYGSATTSSGGMDHGGGPSHGAHHHTTTLMPYSGASALAQAAHAIGRAMQMDSSALYGSGAMIDVEEEEEERERKFCPVPMYGESLYGPGGQ